MSDFYSEDHRRLQDRFGSRPLADRLEKMIVHASFDDADIAFIQSSELFFLSTVDASGHPTVSFKGGNPGFVRVRENTLVIPCYDGNGMFLSVGNIATNPKVGLLFIDFEQPRRLRVQGMAHLDEGPAVREVPGAQFLIRIEPQQIFVNCPRYVPRYTKIESSKFNPDAEGKAPLPDWKRLKEVHDVLSPRDQQAAEAEGLMSIEEATAIAAPQKSM
jgi:predicted pyridoxine 5'-phosphate oxidase superfamily flavin-nucleotide-binding protein